MNKYFALSSLYFLLLTTLTAQRQDYTAAILTYADGQQQDCFMRHLNWSEWSHATKEIEIKDTPEGPIRSIPILDIQSFEIIDQTKYLRYIGPLEVSPRYLSELGYDQAPILQEDTVLIKVVVEGLASLYYYAREKDQNFLYRVSNQDIAPLIYKRYLASPTEVHQNTYYKSQLHSALAHENLDIRRIRGLAFERTALKRLFVDYNQWQGSESRLFRKRKLITLINISPKIGYEKVFPLRVTNSRASVYNTDFESATNFRYSIEIELTLPLGKENTSILFDPSIYKFVGMANNGSWDVSINYEGLELPISVRQQFLVGSKLRPFLQVGLSPLDIKLLALEEQRLIYEGEINLRIDGGPSIFCGLGARWNDRLLLHLNYRITKDLIGVRNSLFNTRHPSLSVMIGYNIL